MTSPSKPAPSPAELEALALVRGALFDFMARLTTLRPAVTVGASEESGRILEPFETWARDRGNLALGEARVGDWQDALPAFGKLAMFGALVFEKYTDPATGWADLDGGDIQDLALKAGVFEPARMTVPCGDSCICAESANPGAVVECNRFAAGVADLAVRLETATRKGL